MDFRIDMVRTSGQNDTASVVFLHPGKSFFAFLAHIVAGLGKLYPRLMNGSFAFGL